MAKSICLCFLLSLVLLIQGSIGDERQCEREGLGLCTDSCDELCKNKHGLAAHGKCQDKLLCICYYNCPLSDICISDGGYCTDPCATDSCCGNKCASMFKEGGGMCVTAGPDRLCECQFPC